ncbi:helix-turn-helix domain-containing protein [Pseudoxanthomonas mexicana]
MTTKKQTLKDMRLDKRLTQAEVAEKMKVSQAYYSAVERGQKPGENTQAMQVINRMRFRGDRTRGR